MTPIRIDAKITGADKTSDEFRQARREIYRRTRSGIKDAGERAILPGARSGAQHHTPVVSTQIVVKTTASTGYLTVASKKGGRIVGLLNFGGEVRGPIRPKKKKAVAFGGVVVSQVATARHYDGSHFLEEARDRGLPMFSQILLERLMVAFDPLEHTP